MLEYYINDDIKKVHLKGKGYGLVATKLLKKGTIVIREKPSVSVDSRKSDNDMLEIIYLVLSNTDINIKKKFMAMHPHSIDKYVIKYEDVKKEISKMNSKIQEYLCTINEEEMRLYCAKYMRNAFRFGQYGSSLLFYGAILNHSCTPNVEFNLHNGSMVFTTTKDIKPNEEICDSYVPLTDCQYKRHERLLNQYGFRCECKTK